MDWLETLNAGLEDFQKPDARPDGVWSIATVCKEGPITISAAPTKHVAAPKQKAAAPALKPAATQVVPAAQVAATPQFAAMNTTQKRLDAMTWIVQQGLLTSEKSAALAAIMARYSVPRNYASDWLRRAA